MYRPIVIVEGPAGSGKSTLCERLSKHYHLQLISSSLGTRSTTPADGAIRSFHNDQQKLERAMTVYHDGALIDRLILSQWVYGSINAHLSIPRIPPPELGVRALLQQAFGMHDDMDFRCKCAGIPSPKPPKFLLITLLSPPEILLEARAKALNEDGTKREYPYDHREELNRYAYAADRCLRYPPQDFRTFVFDRGRHPVDRLMFEVQRFLVRSHDKMEGNIPVQT